jgi:hypothetical protein
MNVEHASNDFEMHELRTCDLIFQNNIATSPCTMTNIYVRSKETIALKVVVSLDSTLVYGHIKYYLNCGYSSE